MNPHLQLQFKGRGVRYIPPVDTPCYSTYMGCYRVSPPPTNSVQTNPGSPLCPSTLCSHCSGYNCKCNMDHMRNPFKRRYFVYSFL